MSHAGEYWTQDAHLAHLNERWQSMNHYARGLDTYYDLEVDVDNIWEPPPVQKHTYLLQIAHSTVDYVGARPYRILSCLLCTAIK